MAWVLGRVGSCLRRNDGTGVAWVLGRVGSCLRRNDGDGAQGWRLEGRGNGGWEEGWWRREHALGVARCFPPPT